MEKNRVVIKGSFRGISADLAKNIVFLIASLVIYLLCKAFIDKQQINTSFIDFLLAMDNLTIVCMLAVVYLIIIIDAIIAISTIIKILGTLYHLADEVVLDYTANRIVLKTYAFPFTKTTDENRIDEVINVNIEQGAFHRLFNVGNLYIEFLAYNSVDSQLRNIEVKCVELPFLQKNKIM